VKRIEHLEPGLIFGRWLVIGPASAMRGGRRAQCRCACGAYRDVYIWALLNGLSTSCGCLKNEKFAAMSRQKFTKHGMTESPEYRSWSGMIDRCENQNSPNFEKYGNRGISVCDRWRWGTKRKSGFSYFFEDMGQRPPGCSIERIHNDKGYSKKNCKWGTRKEQNNNQRPKRKGIPLAVKASVLSRQKNRCACGELLGKDTQFDHRPSLISRKVDYERKVYVPDQLDPEFIEALHPACHLQRTVGRKAGAAKTVHTRGSDAWLKAKFNRLEGRTKKKKKQKIPARAKPWPKRGFAGNTRKF
jgi:hypothetical protein